MSLDFRCAHAEKLPYQFLGVPGQVVQLRRQTGEVAVLTLDGVLVLEEVETTSSGRVPASTIMKSTRTRLGLNLSRTVVTLSNRVRELEDELRELKNEKTDDRQ